MKKHCYNSLKDFYAACTNDVKSGMFAIREDSDSPWFTGLSLYEIQKSKFSYAVGVEQIRHFKDFKVEKDITVKYWNQFDGYDIDVDRMMDNLDFLLDNRKKRLLPKTMDIFVNIGERGSVSYEAMLNKTHSVVSIVDKLETIGVRCAVYSCVSGYVHSGSDELPFYLEICVKQYADMVNLGALCTSISPWMFRHWGLLFLEGKYPNVTSGVGHPDRMPKDTVGIVIDHGQCLNITEANRFIETIKVA